MNCKYALVKWVSGEDLNKYTPNVPISWIKGFDVVEFVRRQSEENLDDDDASYVIEWHQTKVQPKGGWPCYDGIVISISHSVKALEKMLVNFNGEESRKFRRTSIGSIDTSIISPASVEPRIKCATVATQTCAYNEEYNNTLEDLKSGMLRIEKMITSLQQLINGNLEQNLMIADSSDKSDEQKLIEIFPESGVSVTESQWDEIKMKTTSTAMAIALVLAIFPMEILLESNLKGGTNKVAKGKAENTAKYKALDLHKMTAIYNCIRKKYGPMFDKSKVGAAINNKLNKLRVAKKQATPSSQSSESSQTSESLE